VAKYDDIRFFDSYEVRPALESAVRHPMIRSLFLYTFPDKTYEEITDIVLSCTSIDEFQRKVIYHTAQRVIDTTSAGLSTSGFNKLESGKSYLYISNHRDILLDTVILNVTLFDHDLIRTASAIGDNLVQKPFLEALAKLNRNFLVKRNLTPREMLHSSTVLSEYIYNLLNEKNRSVWVAQREGRTKDGNDLTQQGVLKMLDLARPRDMKISSYFNALNIVPVSISYEYDPTDALKVPELLAKRANENYVKSQNEDFTAIMQGALGQKKHIHLAASKPIVIPAEESERPNATLRRIAKCLDDNIYESYKLWPSNYIAADMLAETNTYQNFYTDADREQFRKRMALRTDMAEKEGVKSFLKMYATPVKNKEELLAIHDQ